MHKHRLFDATWQFEYMLIIINKAPKKQKKLKAIIYNTNYNFQPLVASLAHGSVTLSCSIEIF